MTEDLIKSITESCFANHQELIKEANEDHLKKLKRAINVRVGLPVGVLSVLLMWIITTNYNVGVTTASHRAAVDQTIETQTLNLGIETKARELSDEELRKQIDVLERKLDSNFKWLIENSNIKYRGANPLLDK